MTTDIIVLNNAEAGIYNELRKRREEWLKLVRQIINHPEDRICYEPMCDIMEKNYKTCRRFVMDAWGIQDVTLIENILDGKYKVIPEEGLEIANL